MIKKIILFFEKRKIISTIFLFGIIGLMWYLSSIPGSAFTGIGSIWPSIIYHFLIFAAFAFCLIAVINNKKVGIKVFLIMLLISLGISCLDEIHQYFVPMRSTNFQDVLTDLLGAGLSGIFYAFFRNKKSKA